MANYTIKVSEERVKELIEGKWQNGFLKESEREQLRSQLTPEPDRMTVLREQFEPSEHRLVYLCDFSDMSVALVAYVDELYRVRHIKREIAFAPTEALAKEIVQIRKGEYRPTQADIDAKVPFWRYDNESCEKITSHDGCCITHLTPASKLAPRYSFFFTAAQRDNYAARQAKREPDAIAEPELFIMMGDKLFFGTKKFQDGYTEEPNLELNRMRQKQIELDRRMKGMEQLHEHGADED